MHTRRNALFAPRVAPRTAAFSFYEPPVARGLPAVPRIHGAHWRKGDAMRVRMPPGVKRVTVIGGSGAATIARSAVHPRHLSLATEDIKFSVIDPERRVRRGVVQLELGELKSQSKALKPIEKRIRRLVRAEHKALGRYLVLHNESNRKRRNGWVKDLARNVKRVIRRAT